MDIDRIKAFISFEESLPERTQKDWSFCQKHKCNLGGMFVGKFLNPRNHGSSPQQLLFCHVMHSFGWAIWSEDGGDFWMIVWSWDWSRKRRSRQRLKRELVELKIEGKVFERESDDGDSDEQTRGKCKNMREEVEKLWLSIREICSTERTFLLLSLLHDGVDEKPENWCCVVHKLKFLFITRVVSVLNLTSAGQYSYTKILGHLYLFFHFYILPL